jgi:H+/Cl- antiporter ClcA
MATSAPEVRPHPARVLLPLLVPAVAVGVVSAVSLAVLSELAGHLETLLWDTVPDAFDVSGDSGPWIILVLTLTGLVVGLVLWLVPGHGGPDPATEALIGAPIPLLVLPGLALLAIIGLGGGVSLGPENPIVAINVGLTFAVGRRLLPRIPADLWVALAVAATVGALFATPVAAALLLTELMGGTDDQPLWSRLYAPLAAAAVGAATMIALDQPSFAIDLPPFRGPQAIDLLTGSAIAVVAILLTIGAVYVFRVTHRLFHGIRNIVIMTTLGGLVLGLLGAIGGTITLFKGLEQVQQLAATVDDYSSQRLLVFTLIKLVALVIAATAGFRGGRIFPSVFVGAAFGLFVTSVFDGVPAALAVGAGVLGVVLVVSKDGWMALFVAAIFAGNVSLLPVLVFVMLPAWLLVAGAPPMQIIQPPAAPPPAPDLGPEPAPDPDLGPEPGSPPDRP